MSAIATYAKQVRGGEQSALEGVQDCLARIRTDAAQSLNAVLSVDSEGALTQAAHLDERRRQGEVLGPLAGVPVLVKDNICVRGQLTTCASRILEGWRAPYDATVVQRLRAADAIVIGRTNMDEFAMGSSNENSAYGPVHNPWDTARVPGGSSGGSAAAVAAGLAPLALGSDTGGSVRQPGAFCGLTALKPTYGRVSRFGLVAFASSLDQVGPLASSPSDCALALSVMAGHDVNDATSLSDAVDCDAARVAEGLGGRKLRIGIYTEAQLEGVDAQVRKNLAQVCDSLKAAGHSLVPVTLPHASHAVAVYYIVAPAEASSNLSRFDGVRYGRRVSSDDLLEMYERSRGEGFGTEVQRRIMLGTYALASGYYDAYYLKAQKVRTRICEDFAAAFADCDLILSPTAPTPAFGIGEVADPLAMYLSDTFTLPASLAGLPAVSVPSGTASVAEQELALGVHLVAPALQESLALSCAQEIYAAHGMAPVQASVAARYAATQEQGA